MNSFKDDPFGRRIEKVSPTTTSIFADDGEAGRRAARTWRPRPFAERLFPFTKKRSDDARIATAMEYRKNKQRHFIRCIGNKEIPHGTKAQRSRSQIGAPVTLLRERDHRLNRFVYFFKNAVGGTWIVSGDVFPNFV